SRFRLVFRHAGQRFYTGLYGLRPIYQDGGVPQPPPSRLQFNAEKFITADDVLVSIVRVHNPTDQVQTIHVAPIIRPKTTFSHMAVGSVSGLVTVEDREVSAREPRSLSLEGRQALHGRPVDFLFRYAVLDDPPRTMKVAFDRSARGAPFEGFGKTVGDA